ncbi:MAG: hypothetical protein NWR21_00565, partial [Verrucomicrobiales bacterium]|nr:hypothetical protein [Verrucomicrobiales bacterium]
GTRSFSRAPKEGRHSCRPFARRLPHDEARGTGMSLLLATGKWRGKVLLARDGMQRRSILATDG